MNGEVNIQHLNFPKNFVDLDCYSATDSSHYTESSNTFLNFSRFLFCLALSHHVRFLLFLTIAEFPTPLKPEFFRLLESAFSSNSYNHVIAHILSSIPPF